MQRLHLVPEDRRLKHDEMLLAPVRGVQPISGVLHVGRKSVLLVLQSEWQKCGAVVPHCDFQRQFSLCAYTERVQARAPAHGKYYNLGTCAAD